MYKINRKWKRKSNSAPPCEGSYLYQTEYVNGIKSTWMTETRYNEFKRKVIKEEWKK